MAGAGMFLCVLRFWVTPPVSRVSSSHRADSTCSELKRDRDFLGIGSLSGSCLFSLLDYSQDLDSAVRGGTPAGEQCGPESRGRVQASGASVSNVCRGRAREGAPRPWVGPAHGLDVALAPRGIDAAWRCDPHGGLRCRDTSIRLPEFPRGIVFSRKKQEEPASEPPCGVQSRTRKGRGGDGQPLLGGGLCLLKRCPPRPPRCPCLPARTLHPLSLGRVRKARTHASFLPAPRLPAY